MNPFTMMAIVAVAICAALSIAAYSGEEIGKAAVTTCVQQGNTPADCLKDILDE